MLCELYLLAEISCTPHVAIAANRIDITEYVRLNLALSQCSIVQCESEALSRIKRGISCEYDEIERLYLQANPDADLREIEAERERVDGEVRFFVDL